jgi:hypothetical protein
MRASIMTEVAGLPQEATASAPGRTATSLRRRVVAVAATIALVLGLGTAGGALAFGLIPNPFDGPAPAPVTSTPAATPTPAPAPTETTVPTPEAPAPVAPDYSAPTPSVAIDCSALTPSVESDGLVTAPLLAADRLFEPRQAVLAQAGVLNCFWYAEDVAQFSLVTLDVAPGAAGGEAEVAARLAAGAVPLGVGDASSISCDTTGAGCQASLVAGDHWVEFSHEGNLLSGDGPATMAGFARSIVAALEQSPAGDPAWTPPPTSWAQATDCTAIAAGVPVADVAGNPNLVGPTVNGKGTQNGIRFSLASTYSCWWALPDGAASQPDRPTYIGVQLAPGARWAYDAVAGSADAPTPVAVEGADAAMERCTDAEGTWCSLDVLTDDSWLQITYSPDPGSDYPSPLVPVAEAILAAHG